MCDIEDKGCTMDFDLKRSIRMVEEREDGTDGY